MARSSRSSLLVALALGLGTTAQAHPADELVQTTFVTVTREKVVLELAITPGEQVAAAYAAYQDSSEKVRRDLSLSLDGKPLSLTARPQAQGGYCLEAALPTLAAGKHTLRYTNHHKPLKSGYLAAALLGEGDITIGLQSHSSHQQSLTIEYTLARSPLSPFAWIVVALLGLGGSATLLVKAHVVKERGRG